MKFLEEVEGLVSDKIGIIKTIYTMVKLETKLAGLSVYPLLLNLCALLVVGVTIWLSTMFLFGYSIASYSGSTAIGIGSTLGLNILVLLGLLKYLFYNLKNMGFEKTRAYLLKMRGSDHAELTPTNSHTSRLTRKKVALAKNERK